MTFALAFPVIDPVLVEIGPFAIRWYALAYISGLLLGWWLMRRLATRAPYKIRAVDIDDFLVWATLGVVLGGRLGYVLFYKPEFYAAHPMEIIKVWQGGMSFHGGFLGVVIAAWLFARKRSIPAVHLADLLACTAPIGLFFGRIANFINGELWGRVSDMPWAVIFPRGGPAPRHPSQIYESLLEGLVLFAVVNLLARNETIRRHGGLLCGVFVTGYGVARGIVENFRQPDEHLGFLFMHVTMGQILSLPMILAGLALIFWARRVTRP